MDFLKELLKLQLQEDTPEDDVVAAKDMDVDDEVHNKLDSAAEDDKVDTQCFGLETEDGKVVKVYVAVNDAEGFEAEMSKRLGENDDIKAALEELEKEFDIVDVVWPEEESDDDDNDEEDDENPDGEDKDGVDPDEEDGSDSMNPNVNYDDTNESLTLGQRFTRKLTELKWSDENDEHYQNARAKDKEDEENDVFDEKDETDEPAKPKKKIPTGTSIEWQIKKDKKGLTMSNEYFQIDLTLDEMLELINRMSDKQVARFKNEDGKVAYVFSPRGNDYILKTPEYPSGFRITSDTIDQILD